MNMWTLAYEKFIPSQELLREALCTLGNGYFATRGAAPESQASSPFHYPGTYAAACYNRLVSEVAGREIENESLVNLPNWLPLGFRIDEGDWFDSERVALLDYRQELNVRRGVLTRLIRFKDERDRRTRVLQRRFVHMGDAHLAGLEMTVVAENWSGSLGVRSGLDARVTNGGVERYRELNNNHLVPVESWSAGEDTVYMQVETNQSHIRVAEAARTRVHGNGKFGPAKRRMIEEPGHIAHEFCCDIQEGEAVTVEKIASLYTSRDQAISECGLESRKKVERAGDFDALLETHVLGWGHLWRRFQTKVECDERTALILNTHTFHLLQTVSPKSIGLDIGVPARGLHGEAYRGHIFWDELFIFPLLNFRAPDLMRSLLMYRYRRLDEARWSAKQAGYRGAMFPWQSSSNGREESQKLHLNPRSGRWIPDNTHLQRHINAAIAYNVWSYYQVTNDVDFMCFYGAEMLIEIARFLVSIVGYNGSLDRYEIHGVVGPDEYHDAYPDARAPGINNNAYTNVMAVWVLCRALEVLELIPAHRQEALWDRLSLRREELQFWEDISRKMFVPFHDDGIISQFEGYDKLEEFDWVRYKEKYGDIQRLDRILESEGDSPNRYRVSKQADALMLFYLLSAEELTELFTRLGYSFKRECIRKNIEYYLKRTSHGSTLSRVVHSWVLARSDRERSFQLFQKALDSDVSDIQGGTTHEGIHLGAMAGTVDLAERCYSGLEIRRDMLRLNPLLPSEMKSLQFDILYRNHLIDVRVTSVGVKVRSRPSDAPPVKIGFRDRVDELKSGHSMEFKLTKSAEAS
jgi:alpha,alpha-trehalase